MWVWRFYGCHKTAKGGGCFLGLQRFSAPVSVWRASFSSQEQHMSMLNSTACGCESMYRLLFSPQESMYSAMQIGQLAWPVKQVSAHREPAYNQPYKQFWQSKNTTKNNISNSPNFMPIRRLSATHTTQHT
jgi:hypothetical protein